MNHFWFIVLIHYIVIGLVLLGSSSAALRPPSPKTPADVRFAALRCLGNSSLLDTLQLPIVNSCAIKCFLTKLGVINLKSRGLDIARISLLWRDNVINYEKLECFSRYRLGEPLNDLCISYHNKSIEFHRNCPELFEETFTGIDVTGRSKFRGQTVTEFCELIGARKATLQYCILRGFHYFDGYGRLDESEVILNYREAQSLKADFEVFIKECVHSANALYDNYEEMSAELIKCLDRKTKVFQRVYRRRNSLSRYY